MTTLAELLAVQAGGTPTEPTCTFTFGHEHHGAFGGVFGGLVAAAAVHTARVAAGDRTPAGLDCRFLRALPAGPARATATIVHAGRRLTCVRVDIAGDDGRLATTATASFVDPATLHPLDAAGPAAAEPARLRPWSLPPGVEAPIMGVLDPHLGSATPGAITARITLPWDEPGAGAAESACMAADLCVGPPVAPACEGTWLPHPNPDLALRFTPVAVDGRVLSGVGRVVGLAAGLAVVTVEVHAGGTNIAAGVATSMLLGKDNV